MCLMRVRKVQNVESSVLSSGPRCRVFSISYVSPGDDAAEGHPRSFDFFELYSHRFGGVGSFMIYVQICSILHQRRVPHPHPPSSRLSTHCVPAQPFAQRPMRGARAVLPRCEPEVFRLFVEDGLRTFSWECAGVQRRATPACMSNCCCLRCVIVIVYIYIYS